MSISLAQGARTSSVQGPAKEKGGSSKLTTIGLFLGPIAFAGLWFAEIPGLSQSGTHALAIVVLAATWWIFMVMPPVFPALLACVLFLILNVVRPVDAFSGFVSPSIWLVLFALVIAKGIEKSGLGKRIATTLMAKTVPSFNGIVIVLIALCAIFPFFIPAAPAVVSLVMVLTVGLMDALGIERSAKNRISCGLTCFIAVLVLTLGRCTLTGTIANFIGAGLVRDLSGVDVSWLEWLENMWICMPIPMIATYFYVTRRYKPDVALSPEKIKQQVESSFASLGPWKPAEIRAAALAVVAILLWAFGKQLGIGTSQVGIGIGVLFLMPYIGCLTLPNFKALPWDIFAFAGGSYSMGVVLSKTGFAQWAASGISALSFLEGQGFLVIGFLVVLFAFALHFLLETQGEVSLLTPIMVKAALLPPKATAILLPYGSGLYVFPFQSTVMILSLGFNSTGWKDITQYAIFITIIGLLQTLLLLAFYWPYTMI